jgi:hypothetical protein
MVSGCVGFVGYFALTFGPSLGGTVRFVRKVSRIFQVARPALRPRDTNLPCLVRSRLQHRKTSGQPHRLWRHASSSYLLHLPLTERLCCRLSN